MKIDKRKVPRSDKVCDAIGQAMRQHWQDPAVRARIIAAQNASGRNSQPVFLDDVWYPSKKAAFTALGITRVRLDRMLNAAQNHGA